MTAIAIPPGYRPIDPYEDAPPDVLFEVVNGERVEKDMSFYEQYLGGRIHELLAPFCRQNNLGRSVTESTFRMPGNSPSSEPRGFPT